MSEALTELRDQCRIVHGKIRYVVDTVETLENPDCVFLLARLGDEVAALSTLVGLLAAETQRLAGEQ